MLGVVVVDGEWGSGKEFLRALSLHVSLVDQIHFSTSIVAYYHFFLDLITGSNSIFIPFEKSSMPIPSE